MENPLSRKEFLHDATKYTLGVAAGVGVVSALTAEQSLAKTVATPWPWPYAALDIEKVRKTGHDAYWSGKGCSYGAFHALVTELRTVVGDPYNDLPTELMIYGHGGTVGWGTLCGALNGASALISLVCTKERADIIVNEILGLYTGTLFPTDISNQYGLDSAYADNRYTQTLAQNSCGSVLCHVSVTEWCKVAATAVGDLKRKERCARLTGDVAAMAASLLNNEFQGTFATQYASPESVAICGTCHGATGTIPRTAVKMECVQCHGNMHNSIATGIAGAAAAIPTFRMEQNYPNPFNPETRIEFVLPEAASVSLGIYDLNGRLVRELVSAEHHGPGTFERTWNGMGSDGKRVASGIYFARLQAGNRAATIKMSLMK
ncbi:MAG: C-GCAxxG-C-C family (seleno)protein [Bacteroidota bacterium]